jgi:hypothetical protein
MVRHRATRRGNRTKHHRDQQKDSQDDSARHSRLHHYSRHRNVRAIMPRMRKGELVKTYTPKTIDTLRINLGPDLEELVERLAENNHDHWARKRIDEGWQYGAKRNDNTKQHPDLVPYEQLPESEKEYDRKTVIEALKAIIALGYEVRKRPPNTSAQH